MTDEELFEAGKAYMTETTEVPLLDISCKQFQIFMDGYVEEQKKTALIDLIMEDPK